MQKSLKNEIDSLKKEYEEKINKIKSNYEADINQLKKENQDLKMRIDKMLEEYQLNLKEKDNLGKKVRFIL